MRKKLAAIALTFTMTGCVTFGQMDEGMQALIGRPASTAVSLFGYPASERTVTGMRLVRWSMGEPYGYYCNIDVRVDDRNVIRGASYAGNVGGCEPYIRILNNYRKTHRAD